MKRIFYLCLIWLVIHTRIYLLWSRFHQFVFQRNRAEIPVPLSVDDIMQVVRTSKWTADKWWMLWDAISHPEWAYNNYLTKGTLGDCDDYAAFSCYCLQQLDYKPTFLSVQWLDSKNKFHGHNVAIYRDDDGQLQMISNGFYKPLAVENSLEAARWWAKRAGGELLAACYIQPDLKKVLGHHIGK